MIFNAASRKKTTWEKKNWSFNFFHHLSSFLQSIDHIGKKGPHNEKCSHVQKVTKWVHFRILSPPNLWWQNTKLFCCWHKCFYMLSIHGYILFGKQLLPTHIGCCSIAWRTFGPQRIILAFVTQGRIINSSFLQTSFQNSELLCVFKMWRKVDFSFELAK